MRIARAPERACSVEGRVLTVRIPGTFVSRTHARLARAHDTWELADLASSNGTFVNGVRVARAVLADGDVFECGRTLFLFRAALRPAPAEPLAALLPALEGSHARLAAAAARANLLLVGPGSAVASPVGTAAPSGASSPRDASLHARLAASLAANRGNVAAVGRDLGKAPAQIHRWMKKLGLDPDTFRREA